MGDECASLLTVDGIVQQFVCFPKFIDLLLCNPLRLITEFFSNPLLFNLKKVANLIECPLSNSHCVSVCRSEDVGPGVMLGRRNLTITEEVVTDTAEDFKLLLSGQFSTTFHTKGGFSNDSGDVMLEHGWLVVYVNIINPTG